MLYHVNVTRAEMGGVYAQRRRSADVHLYDFVFKVCSMDARRAGETAAAKRVKRERYIRVHRDLPVPGEEPRPSGPHGGLQDHLPHAEGQAS